MNKSTSVKMGIKEGWRAILVNAPDHAADWLELPPLTLENGLSGEFDYIHLFANNQKDFHKLFPKSKAHLKPTGALWVSWPKSGQQGTDLTLPIVIKLGYEYGLVESKCLSINTIWSALKFTFPKQGKVYNNSFGKLQ